MLNYSTQYYTKQISVSEYLNHYRDAERFGTYCKACPNYAKSWACPPFDFDVEQRLSQYHNLLLIVCKITPSDTNGFRAEITVFRSAPVSWLSAA